MRVKDYMRLGKESIKSRKKSTRNTVRGICFGLIMLIPVIFFTLAFYIGLTNEINANKTVSVFNVYMRNARDEGATIAQKPYTRPGSDYVEYKGLGILSFDKGNSLTQDDSIDEKTYSEYYAIRGMQYGNIGNVLAEINGVDYTIASSDNDNNMRNNNEYRPDLGLIKVANLGLSDNKYFLNSEKSEVEKDGGKILSQGEGFDIATGGKQQVLISEYWLDKLVASDKTKPNAQEVVGKKISLTNTVSRRSGENNSQIFLLERDDVIEEDNYSEMGVASMKFITEFEIAGVISKDYYALPSGAAEAHIMLTEKSLYINSDKDIIEPQMTIDEKTEEGGNYSRISIHSRYVNGFEETASQAASMGVMCVATGFLNPVSANDSNGGYFGVGNMLPDSYSFTAPMSVKMQMDNYSKAAKYAKTLETEYKAIFPGIDPMEGAVGIYANDAYGNFKMLNTIGTYLMLILYAFGGIIFFATMLNLYNSVNYSVESRRNYMGVMRAIGAKQKVVPKLYFFEIILIFMRALIWVLIFSAAISYGMKYLIDMLFREVGGFLNITLSLNFAYYFVTLGIVLLAVFLIALAFSQIACKHVAGKPILTVLSDDKG